MPGLNTACARAEVPKTTNALLTTSLKTHERRNIFVPDHSFSFSSSSFSSSYSGLKGGKPPVCIPCDLLLAIQHSLVRVQCCFTSTDGLFRRDREPRTATSTFTQLLPSSEHCSDFIEARKRHFTARSLRILFEDASLDYLFNHTKEINVFAKLKMKCEVQICNLYE